MDRASGTIPDFEIQQLCKDGKLITENFESKNIKQACYELRASRIYYEDAENKNKKILNDGEYILLKPKKLVVIITMERLHLSADIMGRILTKGQLFSIGVLPVNTYADPGFQGNLGIVLFNLSNDYLRINPGEAIAKIEFSRLSSEVHNPYHGQHGYNSKMWPKPDHMILTEAEKQADSRINKVRIEEIAGIYGKDVGDIINRVFGHERRILIANSFFIMLSFILLAISSKTSFKENSIAFCFGILSSAVMVIINYFATNIRRR